MTATNVSYKNEVQENNIFKIEEEKIPYDKKYVPFTSFANIIH